jgi:hypothetical protein
MSPKQKKDKQGQLMIGGVVLVVVAVLALKVSNDQGPKPDPTGCLDSIPSDLVMVVDHSEGVSEQTMAEVKARALAAINQLPLRGRASVFTIIKDSKTALHPVFKACRPPKGSEVSSLTANPDMVNRDYENKFLGPLKAAIEQRPSLSEESPIAQVITDLSLSEYFRSGSTRLLVFSDLLENTPAFTIYGCASGTSAVDAYRRARSGAMERPKFKNLRIDLNLIPRLNISPESVRCRAQFWNWFFGDNEGEAATLTFEELPG